MSKGDLTIIFDPNTNRVDVDIDLPGNECAQIEEELSAMLELLGLEGGRRVMREAPPGQTEGNPSKTKVGGDGG